MRESRDSEANPQSTGVVIAQDVTGSMSPVLMSIINKGLPTLFTELYERKPVTDPHVLLMGIGDVICDSVPLQVTQFESQVELINDQLRKVYLEQGGGGNNFESYILGWLFAALRTSMVCWEKRRKKGYFFSIGDEQLTPKLSATHINQYMGGDSAFQDVGPEELFAMVSRSYHVFHLMVEQGNYMRRARQAVIDSWTKLLGQRAMVLADHHMIAEVIVSAIQVNEGADTSTVVGSWDGSTAMVVGKAIDGLTKGTAGTEAVVRL